MIITITGKPCSGKSTIAKILVEKYGFKRIGVGDIFKEEAKKRGMNAEEFNAFCMNDPSYDFFIDKKTEELGKSLKGQKVIFDSRLAWHFVPESFKVYVDLDEEEMAKRLANSDREGKEKFDNIESAKKSLKSRRQLEIDRYKKLYNVDIEDLSNFDYILDSSSKTPEQLATELLAEYQAFCTKGNK